MLSDSGPQFAAKFFQSVDRSLYTTNLYMSTCHPQTNGQVERYNRAVKAMSHDYINEHQDDWDANNLR